MKTSTVWQLSCNWLLVGSESKRPLSMGRESSKALVGGDGLAAELDREPIQLRITVPKLPL